VRIVLLAMTAVKHGGTVSFIAHLAAGMRRLGHDVSVLKVKPRTENRIRKWQQGLTYKNVSITEALLITKMPDVRAIVVCTQPEYEEFTNTFIREGVPIVVHRTEELMGRYRKILAINPVVAEARVPFVVARPPVASDLRRVGAPAAYIPLPYERCSTAFARANMVDRCVFHAVSPTRVSWDKKTLIVAQANELLPPRLAIRILGEEQRVYTKWQIDPKVPGWRTYLRPRSSFVDMWSGIRLAALGRYNVDMSAYRYGSGGIHYCHFEALDIGRRLILNRNWLTGDDEVDETKPVAEFADGPDELAEIVRGADSIEEAWELRKSAAHAILERHDSARVAQQYVDFLEGL
jgi:hypothetical protein